MFQSSFTMIDSDVPKSMKQLLIYFAGNFWNSTVCQTNFIIICQFTISNRLNFYDDDFIINLTILNYSLHFTD